MALIAVQTYTSEGLQEVYVAADAGLSDTFVNDGTVVFRIINGGGAPITAVATVTSELTSGETVVPFTVNVLAGETFGIGPLVQNVYNDAQQIVTITYSDVTSVTVGAFSTPPVTSAGVKPA